MPVINRSVQIAATLLFLFLLPSLCVWSCCSLAPAHFSDTFGLAAELTYKGKPVHVLAYQNNVQNLASQEAGGNAMFLPIPAKPGTMTEKNLVYLPENAQSFLREAEAALPPGPQGMETRGGDAFFAGDSETVSQFKVFDHGSYTVVLANSAAVIPAALEQVPKQKRPRLNSQIFSSYDRWYKGWTFALCCFNNKDLKSAEPLVWYYEPINKDELFFPALDAHDGSPPALLSMVDVNHTLFFGSDQLEGTPRFPIRLSKSLIGLPLPEMVMGQQFNMSMPQGDFVVNVSDARKGRLIIRRELPPAAMAERLLILVIGGLLAGIFAIMLPVSVWLGLDTQSRRKRKAAIACCSLLIAMLMVVCPPFGFENGAMQYGMGIGYIVCPPHPRADRINYQQLCAQLLALGFLALIAAVSTAKKQNSN
jgi:hypothetical protein